MKKIIYIVLVIVLIGSLSLTVNAENFRPQQANFSIIYKEFEIPLQIFSIFVMPGEEIEINITEKNRNNKYILKTGAKTFTDNSSFKWKAPKKSGYYAVIIKEKNNNNTAAKIKLNVFVMHSYGEKNGEYLNGFRIGNYPEIPLNKKKHYAKPEGFIEINKSLLEVKLTPHFKIKQFVTNQCKKLPQYIVIKESLLLKLEYFLQEVNKKGYYADTFGIVSLYRTPYLNKKIGNNTGLSRHLFGDAADIYIDNNGNNWMDDLNKDGKIDLLDANVLFDLALEFDKKSEYRQLQGGLGSYRGNGLRGPFIHIDTRGFHVSW